MRRATYPNGWTLSRHAQLRMDQMGLSARQLFAAIEAPALAYPGRHRCQVRVRDNLAVVVSHDDLIVVTVLWHGEDHRSWVCPAAA